MNPNKSSPRQPQKPLTRGVPSNRGGAHHHGCHSSHFIGFRRDFPSDCCADQAQVVAALATERPVAAAAREVAFTARRFTIGFATSRPSRQPSMPPSANTLPPERRNARKPAYAAALRSLLDDPATPPSVRLRAALAVLERPQFPDQGWSLPERIESPLRQQVLDDMAEVEAGYKMMRMTEAVESRAARADPPQPEPAPEPSGPHHPPPTAHHLPSRCAPCPCGSGLKYKRCCGRSSNAARAA